MLTQEFIDKFLELRDDEDDSLWAQGDMLRELDPTQSELVKTIRNHATRSKYFKAPTKSFYRNT